MKVVLTADVYKHGVAGEVVDVANGFARNYLIPQKLAVKATAGSLKQTEKIRETAAARKAALENKLNDLASQIDGVELVFGRRAGSNDKLYGSVTTMDIQAALLEKTGVDINRRRISQQSIRELGEHTVSVRLGSEFTPSLKIVVLREEEVEAYLAGDLETEETEEAPEEAGDRIVELIEEAEASTAVLDLPEEAAVDEAEAEE